MSNPSNGHGIGASVLRTEDRRFLTGQGRYTDDINLPRQLYACIVRSPEAHAKIVSIETGAASAAPGVAAVFTGKDLEADGVNPLPAGWLIHSKDGSPMVELGHPAMPSDRVRHVGDPVAVVLAGTKAQAKAASMLVDVEYEPAAWSRKADISFDAERRDTRADAELPLILRQCARAQTQAQRGKQRDRSELDLP